jgi:hypothetical protein
MAALCVAPLPADMPELQSVNAEAAASTDSNILAEFWEEIEY